MWLRLRHGQRRSDATLLTGAGVRAASFLSFAVVLAGLAPLARAQVAASASVASDYRYRGVTISDARPAVSLDLAYDTAVGVYAGASMIAANAPEVGPRVAGALADVGYARRVGGGFTLDAGINHASFFRYGYGGGSTDTTEAYAGVIRGPLRVYAYYAPHYFAPGLKTLYLSIDGAVHPAKRLRLFGHIGVLDPISAPIAAEGEVRYDARAGVAAEFRGGEVQLAWTTRTGGAIGPPGAPPRRDALLLGASWFF